MILNNSIFHRIFKNNLAIIIMVFIVMSLAYILAMDKDMMNIKYSQLRKVVYRVDNTMLYKKTNEREKELYKDKLDEAAKILDADIVIFDAKGNITVDIMHGSSMNGIVGSDDFGQNVEDILSGKTIGKKNHWFTSDNNVTIGRPLTYNDIILGGCIISADLRHITDMGNDVILLIAVCAVLTMFAAVFMVYLQSKELSRPIIMLNSAAKDISKGVYTKINILERGEIGELITSFNSMTRSLEKLEEMRSDFVSDVSHELRTPITSISGFVQGMLDGVIPPEKYKKYLGIVLAEIKRLSRLINDMLDSTKYANGVYEFNMKSFNINKLINNVINQMEYKLEEKNLDIEFIFEKKEMNVSADRDSIQRVLINLLDNALKFSGRDTAITIETVYKNDKVVISIGNYGVGIDEKDIDSIFERFYKADKSRANTSGSGIGLYLTNSIIKGHNEHISVESRPVSDNVRYTVFKFTLKAV